jgi:PAS domain S-box-containing protein
MVEVIAWISSALAISALAVSIGCMRRAAYMKGRLAVTVAALRRAEQRFAESEERVQLVFRSQPECMKLHSESGTIEAMNPAGLTMLDAERAEQVIGSCVYDYIAPEYHQRYREAVETVFSGASCSMKFRLIGLKGTQRLIETYVVPLRDARGKVITAMALTRDLTKTQDAEDRAQKHLAELARVARVASMGEMASGIAHELNQPLTAIATYAGAGLRKLEASREVGPEVAKLLAEISLQARRAGEIIRNVRRLVSRSESNTTAVDINEVVQLMSSFAEPEARQYRIAIRTELDRSSPHVCARRIEIEQVIFNLLRNSIEAMSQGEASGHDVVVSTLARPRGGVEISVRDSGPGIGAADLSKVFDAFYTTKTEGMGMGLAISRSIVEGHGSQLTVHPNADRGVTFSFELPVARERMLRVAA